MKLSEKQRIFAHRIAILIIWVYSHPDWSVTFGEAWRSPETQDIYVRTGKSKTHLSKHPDRLAIDLNLFIKGRYITDKEKYRPIGEFWELMAPENRWGGRFGVDPENYDKEVGWDTNHFEAF